jgi:steroid 5-alpha reductase family enzyme
MNIVLLAAGAIFCYMTGWFVVSLVAKRNDIADVAWGLGFIFVAWLSYLFGSQSLHLVVVAVCITIWGLRLAIHIHSRNSRKKEDYRYAAWRLEWGKWFVVRSYLQVYLLQGVFMFLVLTPVVGMASQHTMMQWQWYHTLGVVVWAVGFVFEAVGDYQLRMFMRNPDNKGKIMRYGLWSCTRHPNYFGEVTLWWGVWMMTLGTPIALWSLIGPLTITYLILFVSGIPMLEKKYEGNAEFEEYKRTTPAFFPRLL